MILSVSFQVHVRDFVREKRVQGFSETACLTSRADDFWTIRCPCLSRVRSHVWSSGFVKDRGFAKATPLAAHSDLSARLIVARTPQHTRCVCCCVATVARERNKASAHRCATQAKQARHSGGRGRASQALPHGASKRRYGVGGVSPRGSQEPLQATDIGSVAGVAERLEVVGALCAPTQQASCRPPGAGMKGRGAGKSSPRSRRRGAPRTRLHRGSRGCPLRRPRKAAALPRWRERERYGQRGEARSQSGRMARVRPRPGAVVGR